MRNLRGKGFESYPSIFGTTARTGFLCAIAAQPEPISALPTRLQMEYRHVRTLVAWFTRLGVCRRTDDDVCALDPSFRLHEPLLRYLESLNAEVGEWPYAAIGAHAEAGSQKPVLARTIDELFGTIERAAILMRIGADGFTTIEAVVASRDHSPYEPVKRAVSDLQKFGILVLEPAEGGGRLALSKRPSSAMLGVLLNACSAAIRDMLGNN
jgi:hypothetical protein